MNLARNFSLVGLGYAMRLGAGMAVLLVLARTVGAQEFGHFAFWLTISTLVTIPANFGFPTMVLREFGASPKAAGLLLSEVLTAKVLLSFAVLGSTLVSASWLNANDFGILLLLLGAQLFDSFAEFFNLGFRRFAKFKHETHTAILMSAVHLVFVIGAVILFKSALAAAASFIASRLTALLIVAWNTRTYFQDVRLTSMRIAWLRIKGTWAYALEVALFTAYNQTDTLVINYFLGHTRLGIYQAGMKLVEGACRIAPVLAQILIPQLAKEVDNHNNFVATAWRTMGIFFAVGSAGGVVLFVGAPWIVKYALGNEFAALESLLPLFGLMLLCRYLETATGLLLVAYGLQHRKVWLVLSQMIFVVAAGTYAVQSAGLAGWQVTNIVGLGLITAAYVQLLRSSIKPVAVQPTPMSTYDSL